MADLVLNKLFQNFGRLYLGQMSEMDAMEVTQGGPDTHDGSYKTEAARRLRDPSMCRKTSLEIIKVSQFLIIISLSLFIGTNNSCLVK